MILYKYKSFAFTKNFEYAIDSIKNKYLYFSRPSELNDPFDCQIQIELESDKTEFESWRNRNLDRIPINNRLLTFEGKNQTVNESRTQNGLELVRQRLVEKNHLLSLTPDCLNESMWALYIYNELLCQHKKIHRFKVYKLYSLFVFQFIALEGFIHFIRYTVI